MPQAQEKKQTTQAQKKAMLKYQAKYIEMRLRVTPEYHNEISAHARQMGESDAAFLRRLQIDCRLSKSINLASQLHKIFTRNVINTYYAFGIYKL